MIYTTATKLPRLMQCTGSLKLDSSEPFESDDTAVQEGIASHWFIEQVFKNLFNSEELIDRKAPNGVFITSDMVDFSEEYLDDIMGKGDVEVVTDHGKDNVYEVSGRSDHIYMDNHSRTLYVSDYKYGYRVVEPEMNWILISHALGWCMRNRENTPDVIVFTIYQPRAVHADGTKRSWSIGFAELMNYEKEIDLTLSDPDYKLQTGPNCYKCLSYSQCPAAIIASMNSIDVARTAYNAEIDNRQLSYLLEEIRKAKSVLSQAETAFEDLAKTRMRKGGYVPNHSLQISLGNLAWKKGVNADMVKALANIDVSKEALITPTQAKKAGLPENILDMLAERENKGVKVTRLDLSKKAEKIFGRKDA